MASTVNATLTASGDQVVQLLMEMNAHLKRAAEGAKDVSENAEKAGKELTDAAKNSSNYWTELNSKISVIGGVLSTAWEYAQKFHEIQMKGRKENLQWESMMNSTRAKEISENFKAIDKAFGDNIDKAAKLRMAYSSGFSDIKYDVEAFSNIVQNMAQRTGKEIGEVAEELQNGFLKGDLGILEDNGIMHNAELEMQKYAGSIGKAVDELTDFEKRQANTTILQKYLNAEFNNTKPIQDSYLELTAKATNVTDGFSSKIAELTDNVFGLNNGFKNLSIGKQMSAIAQEIKDAETALWKQGSLSVDIDKDLPNIEKKKSQLLSLQSESASILSSRLVNQMGVRKATSKQEISKIIKDIDKEIETTNDRLKGFIANGKITMTEETSKLMIQIQALKTARNEALKEGSALGNIKQKAVGGKAAESTDAAEEEKFRILEKRLDRQIQLNNEKLKREGDAFNKERQQAIDNMVKLADIERRQDIKNKLDKIARQKEVDDLSAEMASKFFDDKWKTMIAFEEKYRTDLGISGEEVDKMTKKQLEDRLDEEEIFYEAKNKMQEMSVRAAADFTSTLINDVLLGEKEFRKEMIGDFVKGIGDQMVADGTFHIFAGIAKAWGGNPLGWKESQAGAVEAAVGVGMGATAKAIGTTSSESESKSKETAAADRNSMKGDKNQKMDVYLYPDEKRWLRSLNKSNNKLGVQRGK